MARRAELRKPQSKRRGSVLLWLVVLLAAGSLGWWFLTTGNGIGRLSSLFTGEQPGGQADGSVRGTIFDRNYKELAVSLERVSVYVRTRELGSVQDVAARLAPVLETEEEELLAILKEGGFRIWLSRDINQNQEDSIKELNLPGVYLHRDYSRFYPQKTEAAHIIGFTENGIGLAGVEYYYDRMAQEIPGGKSTHNGVAGQHLLLTIDLKIQEMLEDLVRDLAESRPGARLGVYVMDSGIGAIVAAAQSPSFNPNTYRIYSQDILESLLVKTMVVPELFRRLLREAAELNGQHGSRGSLLPWSISATGRSLGAELRMWDELGLERRPSAEFVIAGESGPAGTGYPVGVGQEDLSLGTVPTMLTPLNLLTGLSSLLNGGKKLTGHVAGSVVDGLGENEWTVDLSNRFGTTEVVARDVSQELSSMALSLSKDNVLGGVLLDDEEVAFFGGEKGWSAARNRVIFIAVPAAGAELTVLLTLQDNTFEISPKVGKEQVSPLDALSELLPRIAVLQQVGKGLQSVAEPGEEPSGNFPGYSGLEKVRKELQASLQGDGADLNIPAVMPDVVGLSLRKGLRLLQDKECRIRVYGTGKIISQEPKPGVMLPENGDCVLKLKQEDVNLETLEKRAAN